MKMNPTRNQTTIVRVTPINKMSTANSNNESAMLAQGPTDDDNENES